VNHVLNELSYSLFWIIELAVRSQGSSVLVLVIIARWI